MSDKEENMSDSSDTSSSDSDSETYSKKKNYLNRARQLEDELANSKYLYDVHKELVNIYIELGDSNSVREAFQRFHEYFPLTPTLWMQWIDYEKNVMKTEEDIDRINELFDKAVEDYLSVDLWIKYAEFAITSTNLLKTRAVLERAVNAAGLVCNGASLLWTTYREMEMLHISTFTEGTEEWKNQILKVADIFKRELSIPLIAMDNTYEEWLEWSNALPKDLIDPKPIEYGYKKARKVLEEYKPFEDELLNCETNESLLEIYLRYIQVVKDPSTVVCIFERAAVQLCLISDFWEHYCNYVFNLGSPALEVSKKALRNCPWVEELWIIKLRVLENLNKAEDTIMESFEEGLSSIAPSVGLELWLTYLDYNHRCVSSSEKLDKLFNQAIEQLGFENDPSCKLHKFYSRILAGRGDVKTARKLWGQIASRSSHKNFAITWLEYVYLEKQYGEPQYVRSVFQKALNMVEDYPQYIVDEWFTYERQFGTLTDIRKCSELCEKASKKISGQQSEIQFKDLEYGGQSNAVQGKGKKRKIDQESHQRSKVKRVKEEAKARVDEEKTNVQTPVDKNPTTTVFVSNLLPGVNEEKLSTIFPNAVNLEIARDRKGKSRCFGYVQFEKQEEVMVALARDRVPLDGRPVFISEIKTERAEKKPVFKYATNEEKNKLFVRGLPINKTKEEIEEIFKKYGVRDVRLVLHKSGQPKGLAYLEFETEEEAQKALKETDQMNVDEHIITVAVSAPPPKKERHGQKALFGGTFEKQDDDPIRHARSRLQTSLLPRSLQVRGAQVDKKGGENGVEAEKKMKSNSDFRAMLLKK